MYDLKILINNKEDIERINNIIYMKIINKKVENIHMVISQFLKV